MELLALVHTHPKDEKNNASESITSSTQQTTTPVYQRLFGFGAQ
jgi:hypothetical protein